MKMKYHMLLLVLLQHFKPGHFSGSNSIRELMRASLITTLPIRKGMEKRIREYHEYANRLDYDDCAKKFLCLISGKPDSELDWDEQLLMSVYSVSSQQIDYTAPTVQFNVAAQVGYKNSENCENVYSNCFASMEELQKSLRSQGLSIDIEGTSSDCSLYFLWRNNKENEAEQTDRK